MPRTAAGKLRRAAVVAERLEADGSVGGGWLQAQNVHVCDNDKADESGWWHSDDWYGGSFSGSVGGGWSQAVSVQVCDNVKAEESRWWHSEDWYGGKFSGSVGVGWSQAANLQVCDNDKAEESGWWHNDVSGKQVCDNDKAVESQCWHNDVSGDEHVCDNGSGDNLRAKGGGVGCKGSRFVAEPPPLGQQIWGSKSAAWHVCDTDKAEESAGQHVCENDEEDDSAGWKSYGDDLSVCGSIGGGSAGVDYEQVKRELVAQMQLESQALGSVILGALRPDIEKIFGLLEALTKRVGVLELRVNELESEASERFFESGNEGVGDTMCCSGPVLRMCGAPVALVEDGLFAGKIGEVVFYDPDDDEYVISIVNSGKEMKVKAQNLVDFDESLHKVACNIIHLAPAPRRWSWSKVYVPGCKLAG